jgi:heat shock protein HslJ
MKINIYLMLLTFIFAACKSEHNESKKETLWVNSTQEDCVGVNPMKCLQIKRTEGGNWEYFYNSIEGFSYESGYLYSLEIEIDSIPKEKVAADQSLYSYRLVKVLSKKPDPKFRLNDIWVVTHLEKNELDRTKKLPQIEFSIKKMSMMGSDGCNSVRAKISALDTEKISIDKMMGTRKMCPDMEIATQFSKSISEVVNYKLKDLKLYLYNSKNEEVIRLLKID